MTVQRRFIGPADRSIKAVLLWLFIGQTMRTLATKPGSDDLQFRRELTEAGGVTRAIDTTYLLSEARRHRLRRNRARSRQGRHISVGRRQRPRRKGARLRMKKGVWCEFH